VPRLRNRQLQVPNGLRFELRELKWRSSPFQSFDSIVGAVEQLVAANPALAQKNHWPAGRTAIEEWVDRYNAELCRQGGWHQYIQGDDPPIPKPPAPGLLARLKNVAGAVRKIEAGVETLLDWEKNGQPPVSASEAAWRASICAGCPQNRQGQLTDFFAAAAAEKIRTRLARLHGLKLTTPYDDRLQVCDVCLCPLKLKVFTPLDIIRAHEPAGLREQFPQHCWLK